MLNWLILVMLCVAAVIIFDGLRQAAQARSTPVLTDGKGGNSTPTLASETPALRPSPDRARPASAEDLFRTLDTVEKAIQQRKVPNIAGALAQDVDRNGDTAHHAQSQAAIQALQEEAYLLRLANTDIPWEDLASACRTERMIHDGNHQVFHALDDDGKPAFTLASPTEHGGLNIPEDARLASPVAGLLLILPAADASARVTNFERMVALAYSLQNEHGGVMLDNTGSRATRRSLEHYHEQLLEEARQVAIAKTCQAS